MEKQQKILIRDMRSKKHTTVVPLHPHDASRHLNMMLETTEFPSILLRWDAGQLVITVMSADTEDPTAFLPAMLLPKS